MRHRSCSSALRFGLLLTPPTLAGACAHAASADPCSRPPQRGSHFFILAPPIKPLPYSASFSPRHYAHNRYGLRPFAGRGRERGIGRLRQPMSIYDPRPPSLGNLHSSLRSWGLGWSLGDCSQDSQAPRLRPCSATLRNGRNQPAPTIFAPRFGFLAPVRPQWGLPYCSLCSKTFVNIYFFFLIFRSAQSLHFASKMTKLHYKMSFCRNLLRIRFYTTFVSLLYFAHVERHNINNNY